MRRPFFVARWCGYYSTTAFFRDLIKLCLCTVILVVAVIAMDQISLWLNNR